MHEADLTGVRKPDIPFSSSAVASVFGEFALSERYLGIRDRMFDRLTRHAAEGTKPKGLFGEFSGAVYEELAYTALGEGQESALLLSPEDTFHYFQYYLYQNTPPIIDTFTRSLNGISVPDGLRLAIGDDTSVPTGVYEYTLTQMTERYRPYFVPKYYSHRRRRRDYPQLFRGVPLIFVVPTQPGLPEHIRTRIGRDDVDVIELPFTHKDFGAYIEELTKPLVEDAGFPKKVAGEIDPTEIIEEAMETEIED